MVIWDLEAEEAVAGLEHLIWLPVEALVVKVLAHKRMMYLAIPQPVVVAQEEAALQVVEMAPPMEMAAVEVEAPVVKQEVMVPFLEVEAVVAALP